MISTAGVKNTWPFLVVESERRGGKYSRGDDDNDNDNDGDNDNDDDMMMMIMMMMMMMRIQLNSTRCLHGNSLNHPLTPLDPILW